MKSKIKKIRIKLILRWAALTGCVLLILQTLPILCGNSSREDKYAMLVFFLAMVAIYIVVKRILLHRPRKFHPDVDEDVRRLINETVGPAPWYWKTFPFISGNSRNRYVWSSHGEKGRHSYLTSLSLPSDLKNLKLTLNAYIRPFFVPPGYLGLWFYQNKQIHLLCFDPDRMPSYGLEDLPADFKTSSVPYYTLANPIAELIIPSTLSAGVHNIFFPKELTVAGEILAPIPYSPGPAAYAIFEIDPQAGEVRVFPQHWFTVEKFDLGYQWITRAVRDLRTEKLYGDGIRIGIFQLTDDGCHLERWMGDS